MKYIKLFENFNEEPDMYDALQIVITHLGEVEEVEIDSKWNAKDILRLELLEAPTHDQIKSCKKHLFPEDEKEGFFLYMTGTDWSEVNKNVSVIVGVGSSFEEWVNNWLNDNFGNLKRIE